MKVLRFMSTTEIKAFVKGDRLHNTTDHKATGAHTDSVGFCFMVVDGRPDDGIYHSARYLAGVATTEYCLVGELKHTRWRKGFGMYTNYDGGESPIKRKEVSTRRYSAEDFKHYRIYEPTHVEQQAFAALIGMSSIPWREPRLKHCSCLSRSCEYEKETIRIEKS